MKKFAIWFFGLFLMSNSYCQETKPPADYGYQYFEIQYQNDPVHIVIQTKKGEALTKKPIILFGMGSTPRPLILLDDDGRSFQIFPFLSDTIFNDYHIAVVGKPYIPVVFYKKNLKRNQFIDPFTGITPVKFCERDYVDYYAGRNIKVIEFLKKLDWVDNDKFILAGHSASATEMTITAGQTKEISHLIYSSGNPFGRMMTMLTKARNRESIEKPVALDYYKWWYKVVSNKDDNTCLQGGDPDKTTFDFSQNHLSELLNLNIPVLVSYGTKDASSSFNDYLHLETIRLKKSNFTYLDYVGWEHNYYGFTDNGQVNYEEYNWDIVGLDWLKWLNEN